jgi:hypothetical protein
MRGLEAFVMWELGFDGVGADDGGAWGSRCRVEGVLLRIFWLMSSCSRETLDLGHLDRTLVTVTLSVSFTLLGHGFGTSDAWRGLLVGRCFIYHVDNIASVSWSSGGSVTCMNGGLAQGHACRELRWYLPRRCLDGSPGPANLLRVHGAHNMIQIILA